MLSVNFISADSEKLDPIIFMLDLSVVDSKTEEARKFLETIGGRVIELPYYPTQSSTNIKNVIKKN